MSYYTNKPRRHAPGYDAILWAWIAIGCLVALGGVLQLIEGMTR